MELPKVLKYKTKEGGSYDSTRSLVSIFRSRGLWGQARQGVRGAPRCSAGREAQPEEAKPGPVPTPPTARRGGLGVTGPQRSWRDEGRRVPGKREGRDGSGRPAPHPDRATLQQPDVQRRDPAAVPGRGQLRAQRGCRPDPPTPPQRPGPNGTLTRSH